MHWQDFAGKALTVLYLWQGGLAFHGGIAGGIIGGYLFARIRKLSFPLLADICAPALALGYAITRVGCFLNGCCYGHECDLPWAVTFPANTDAGGVARHPTQLYAVLANLIIFAVLARLYPRVSVRGNLFLLYLVLYSVYRFIVEFFRRGATANVFAPLAPLTEAQTASIIIGLGALVWLLLRARGLRTGHES
jgi:phosphatidylglycerol:prolipoprotein diacylglycerol transferase